MPDYLRVLAVEPEVDELGAGEDDLTWDSLREVLEQRSARWRRAGTEVRVLFALPSETDAFGAFIVGRALREEYAELSLEAERYVEVSGQARPVVALTCDAAEFSDAFAAVSEGIEESADRELALPYRWESVEGLVDLMRVVAPRLAGRSCEALVSIGGAPARLSVDRAAGVSVEPLFPWFEDPVAREMIQKLIHPVRGASATPIAAEAQAVHADSLLERGAHLGLTLGNAPQGTTPLTSGSAQARSAKAWDAPASELLAAIEAPENQGERFAALRLQMMESLVRAGKQPAEGALSLLVRRVSVESASMRGEIYSLLTRFQEDAASQVLAAAFEGDAENAALIKTLVWRQRTTVDLLVARLLIAWTADPPLAKRIIAVLRDEYINVSRAQLAGASPALLAALGPVVT